MKAIEVIFGLVISVTLQGLDNEFSSVVSTWRVNIKGMVCGVKH